jgi:MFS family permease
MQAATQLAVPFLTPYMLRELHFQYIEYVYLLAAAYLARVIMSPLFGKWAHRWGAKRLLWVGGISLAPAGLLWMPLPREEYRLVYLIVVQFATGTAFAAYELATLLMLFETLPNHERAGILTTYNCLNALATVGGSVLGGALLRLAGEQRMAYLLVFGASSLARVLTLPLLRSVLERPLWWRTTAPPAIQSTDR